MEIIDQIGSSKSIICSHTSLESSYSQSHAIS